jgi:hypothetical protein
VHKLPSLQVTWVPEHTPPAHLSPLVHALPSLQLIVLLVKTQPLTVLHASLVQMLPSLHVWVAPAWQDLLAHVSPMVQTLPSLQDALLAVLVQPLVTLQASLVQPLPSSQLMLAPGLQMPPAHVSPSVQTLPSLQLAVVFAATQPVLALHESVVHGLPSLQFCSAPAWQAPFAHVSPTVQTLPSVHAALLLLNTQPVATLQLSLVQPLASLQLTSEPDWQLPPAQTSPLVQALPSSHALVRLLCTQPDVVSHVSAVHGLLSLQLGALLPAWQALLAQTSPSVQALPSEQLLLLALKTQPPTLLQLSVVHGLLSSHV